MNKQQEDNSTSKGIAQPEKDLQNSLEEAKNKPLLELIGRDGNAFFILGGALRTAKKAGWSKEKIEQFMTEAKSGDYDHLLQTCMKWFEVF